jgi:hypothetical protein
MVDAKFLCAIALDAELVIEAVKLRIAQLGDDMACVALGPAVPDSRPSRTTSG